MIGLGIFFRSDLKPDCAGKEFNTIDVDDFKPELLPYLTGYDISVLSDSIIDKTLFLNHSHAATPILGYNDEGKPFEKGDILTSFSFEEPNKE